MLAKTLCFHQNFTQPMVQTLNFSKGNSMIKITASLLLVATSLQASNKGQIQRLTPIRTSSVSSTKTGGIKPLVSSAIRAIPSVKSGQAPHAPSQPQCIALSSRTTCCLIPNSGLMHCTTLAGQTFETAKITPADLHSMPWPQSGPAYKELIHRAIHKGE